MQSALTQQQTALQAEYAKLESALALSQSQESSLASDMFRLPQKCPHAQLPGSRADHDGAAMRSGAIRAPPPADTTSANLGDSPQAHLARLCASTDAIYR
jgi:hypothetical protein